MDKDELIRKTAEFVRKTLEGAEAGHDWSHIQRVVSNARTIGAGEQADPLVTELAALLHDIADSKFHDGDESVGPERATRFLRSLGVSEDLVGRVEHIIRNVSYKNELEPSARDEEQPIELQVLKDADRLDGMGAIGIARAFHYGGFKNRLIYDPEVPPVPDQSKEQYKKSQAPTINHFYEKLLLLKEKMNTRTGQRLAMQRHDFMLSFLDQFYREWEGK